MSTKSERARRCLEATAYHEAGHAVVCCREGRRFRRATIEPDGERGTLGHVAGVVQPKWFRPDLELTPRLMIRAESEIVELWAGPAAERRFTNRWNRVGARGDEEGILLLAERFHGGDVLAKYIAYLKARAEAYVASPVVWPEIEAVAAALIDRLTLTFEETHAVIRDMWTSTIRSA